MQSNLMQCALLSLVCVLCGCSGTNEAPVDRGSEPESTFSEEDKRIASALAIGSSEIDSTGTPQYQAMLCSVALASIADHLRQSGALSAEQLRDFGRIEKLYEQRASEGASEEERKKIREQIDIDHPEEQDRAWIAIGCLRELT